MIGVKSYSYEVFLHNGVKIQYPCAELEHFKNYYTKKKPFRDNILGEKQELKKSRDTDSSGQPPKTHKPRWP